MIAHVDRLTRSPRELEDVIDQTDQRGIELATVTGEIDLATPTGRLIARTLGAAARHEAEHKAERQKRPAMPERRGGQGRRRWDARPYRYARPGRPNLAGRPTRHRRFCLSW
ncbi:recombinase family protein [Microbispora rosea]|uniref:recombinase family protein n=1 Tax=Microbispora rosea TaxID=58117 RepID=UPI0009FB5367